MLSLLPVLAALGQTPDTALLGGVGAAGGETVAGVATTGLALQRWSLLELGVQGQGTVGLKGGQLRLGGLAGLHVGETWSLRVLIGAGLHVYSNVGSTLLSDDPGIDGELPYVGGRLLFGYSLKGRPSARHRAFIGVLASVDEDLGRRTQTVQYMTSPWLFGEGELLSSTHRLGQTTFSGLLLAGVLLDLSSL